jgi:hypothetical protein
MKTNVGFCPGGQSGSIVNRPAEPIIERRGSFSILLGLYGSPVSTKIGFVLYPDKFCGLSLPVYDLRRFTDTSYNFVIVLVTYRIAVTGSCADIRCQGSIKGLRNG